MSPCTQTQSDDAPRPDRLGDARPNFFVIGAARSGTTSLTEMLRQHPEVFVTVPKEPHFLAFAGHPVAFRGPGDDVTLNKVAVTSLHPYLALYRGAQRFAARGEGSVSTLYYSHRAALTIREHFPDAKLIAVLRDPVERAFSSFQFLRARGFETCDDFESALDLETQRIRAGWHHLWHYAAMGRYGRQLERLIEALGDEQLKIVFSEDLARAPDDVLTEITNFLGIRAMPPQSHAWYNASGEPRSQAMHMVQSAIERSSTARRAARRFLPRRVRDRVRMTNLRRGTLSTSAHDRLRDYYAEDSRRLRSVVNGRQPGWLAC